MLISRKAALPDPFGRGWKARQPIHIRTQGVLPVKAALHLAMPKGLTDERATRWFNMTLIQIQVFGGESFVTAEDNLVFKTVLGPCVSACLFDPVLKIGGMNHFLLPVGGINQMRGRDRFADVAMHTLLTDMISLGGNPWRMQAKLFGGKATLLQNTDIGAANALAAKRFLIDHGIRLVESDLGGDVARWITFNPSTGTTTMKRQTLTLKAANEVEHRATMRR